MEIRSFTIQTLERLPYYLHYMESRETEDVSSRDLANALGLNEVQVRKDLAAVSSKAGRPRRGFERKPLIRDIREALGFGRMDEAVIVGVGHLGTALINYKGFRELGLRIVAGFDLQVEDEIWVNETPVFSSDRLKNLIPRLNVKMAILTVNSENAQAVCDELVAAGIRAIWNFSQVMLNVPDNVIVRNENMAASLAVLSEYLSTGNNK